MIEIIPLVLAGALSAYLLVQMPCYAARGIWRYCRRGIRCGDWSYP